MKKNLIRDAKWGVIVGVLFFLESLTGGTLDGLAKTVGTLAGNILPFVVMFSILSVIFSLIFRRRKAPKRIETVALKGR